MRICLIGIALVSGVLAGCSSTHEGANLNWMEGRWSAQAWGGELRADYVARDDGLVIGHSQLFKDDQAVYHEFEVFGRDADGMWVVPHPGGKPAERFELASRSAKRLVFENPDKDFPTRIVYERKGDKLVITLSDPHGDSGKEEVFEFTHTR